MAISEKAISQLRNDSNLRAKLMLVEGKSEYTIKRWLEDKSDYLTMPKYSSVIIEHTGLSYKEVVEAEKIS